MPHRTLKCGGSSICFIFTPEVVFADKKFVDALQSGLCLAVFTIFKLIFLKTAEATWKIMHTVSIGRHFFSSLCEHNFLQDNGSTFSVIMKQIEDPYLLLFFTQSNWTFYVVSISLSPTTF
jgi:hypothetical protein